MSSNSLPQMPFLRQQRKFPQDMQPLVIELDRSYIDIATSVNNRIIGTFPTGSSAQTGESWFITSQRQQGFRRVYTFTAAGNIAHGLNLANISAFTHIYGTFTDGSIWYPLPYVDVVASNNQVSITVTSTNIVITAGAGSPPSITSGTVVLEWISNA